MATTRKPQFIVISVPDNDDASASWFVLDTHASAEDPKRDQQCDSRIHAAREGRRLNAAAQADEEAGDEPGA